MGDFDVRRRLLRHEEGSYQRDDIPAGVTLPVVDGDVEKDRGSLVLSTARSTRGAQAKA